MTDYCSIAIFQKKENVKYLMLCHADALTNLGESNEGGSMENLIKCLQKNKIDSLKPQ
jgi:hypothetical protein